jgi:hypothetical protein
LVGATRIYAADMFAWLRRTWQRLTAFERRNRYRATVPRHVANDREHPRIA